MKRQCSIRDCFLVLKPKETGLIAFIGACSALIAIATTTSVFPGKDFFLVCTAIILGSAGANGLTNYLDRHVDARMSRTCTRALPAKRIEPAEQVLVLTSVLMLAGLVIAWILSPICLWFGVIGIIASAAWRKTVSCTIFGIIASSMPLLIGWYAITKQSSFDVIPILLFCLIALWIPIHVWTVMIANRSDYESAGLHYFPLNMKNKDIIWILFILSIGMAIVAFLMYQMTGEFHLLYLIVSSALSAFMICANLRLLLSQKSDNAWIVYKLSAFPYLGILFVAMVLDIWLL